ncbi:MAG: hypothetical protein GX758_05005 [Tenericutes bacterium]|nr:hypothetical protein [Mycoplasmatota bacterium]
MKRLYIDFDGVVLDTIPYLYSALEKSGADVSNEREIRIFYASFDFSTIINDDNILNDSINSINKLIESKRFEISFLTHVNSLDEACRKTEYLRNKFKDITIIIVPKEISKTKMVHSKDAILVDDYSGNLIEWEENGGIAIRFSKEMESHGYRVIDKLDQLLNIFDENGDLI